MKTSMELSLYPLGEGGIGPTIERFLAVLREHGCEVAAGPMSSMIYGEGGALFSAVSEAYERVCKDRGVVLIIKASNACVPDKATQS